MWVRAQNGEVVAQFKATVLLMPNGSDRITAAPLQKVESDKKVENEDLKKLLASSVKSKKKNKPKKKKAAPKVGADCLLASCLRMRKAFISGQRLCNSAPLLHIAAQPESVSCRQGLQGYQSAGT